MTHCSRLSICCYSTVTHYMTGYNASEIIAGIIIIFTNIQAQSQSKAQVVPADGTADYLKIEF